MTDKDFFRRGSVERSSSKRDSVERSSFERVSLERGVSLLESLFVITAATVFALAVFAYYSQTSTQWSIIETQDDLSRAIRDVQESYPSHLFSRVPSAELSQAVRDKMAPLGDINVSRNLSDPPDAFRITLSNMPSAPIEEICEPLRLQLRLNPHIDRGFCTSSSGGNNLEIRVRGQEQAYVELLYENEIPECGEACNPANWRNEVPSLEDMKKLKSTLDLVTFIYSARNSCETDMWSQFKQCVGFRRPVQSEWRVLGQFNAPGGEPYKVVGYDINNGNFVTGYPTHIAMRIDKEQALLLRKYNRGYRGISRLRCDRSWIPDDKCNLFVFVNEPIPEYHGRSWWQE